MEKDEIVVQSIKKLLSLKLKDEEILDSLVDAGLDYDYAKKLLAEVKQEKEKPKPAAKQKVSEDSSIDESLGIWQEGILTVINQKLDAISEKERNIEKAIRKETQAIVEQEMRKLKIVLDSQRSLLVSRMNASLNEMVAEANKKIESRLEEIAGLEERIDKKTEDVIINYKLLKELKDSVSKQIEELPHLKEELTSKFEAQTAKTVQSADAMLRKYEQKYKEIDTKLNNTLSLASKIVESLVETGKKKLDAVIKSKADAQISEVDEKLKELEVTKSRIIKEIAKFEALREEYQTKMEEGLKSEIDKYVRENMEKIVATIVEKQVDAGFNTFKIQIGNLVKKLQKEVDELKNPKKSMKIKENTKKSTKTAENKTENKK